MLDEELKKLEIELKTEEIKQARSHRRTQWATPTALAIFLPMLGGLALFFLNELKEYNAAYLALENIGKIKSERDGLINLKNSLNLDVMALLALKAAREQEAVILQKVIEDRQLIVDQIYLGAKYAASEATYALGHALVGDDEVDEQTIAQINEIATDLDPNLRNAIGEIVSKYKFVLEMSSVTNQVLSDFLNSLGEMSLSTRARELSWHPEGAFAYDRQIMTNDYFSGEAKNIVMYDIGLGRFLTDEEVREIAKDSPSTIPLFETRQ